MTRTTENAIRFDGLAWGRDFVVVGAVCVACGLTAFGTAAVLTGLVVRWLSK